MFTFVCVTLYCNVYTVLFYCVYCIIITYYGTCIYMLYMYKALDYIMLIDKT